MPAQAIQYLDVRWLPPPEPFEHIMDALNSLPDTDALQVLIHREPFPLYDVLRDGGFVWQVTAFENGNFEILISRAT
ncbi:MAG: DUF2249 domain-containing protein [Sideroxydans sp.]|nr:DUF2249 domain-containing protein [Sideroxydans sp.]